MRYKLISCEVFAREIAAVLAQCPHHVDFEFLPRGLHAIGCKGMLSRLEACVSQVDELRYDAILLAYGFCNNGVAGLKARSIPIVLPRAHNCMTLFFGSKKRYLDYVNAHPGTYFRTTGWMERTENGVDLDQLSIEKRNGLDLSLRELIVKYGEENGRFLHRTLHKRKRYGQLTFLEMGVEPDLSFVKKTEADARLRGWQFENVKGDLGLIQRLVNGDWNHDEFLVVPPNFKIVARSDESIVATEMESV